MFENRDDQLKVLYLFLSADGVKSNQEMSMFGEICKKYDVDKDKKREVIQYCNNELEVHASEDFPALSAIQEIVDKGRSVFSFLNKDLRNSKSQQASTIWNLMNLGYADKDYSSKEKEIVEYLIRKWEIDEVVVLQLEETLNTLNRLYTYKAELQNSYDYSNPKRFFKSIDAVDKDIDNLLKNIAVTVEEVELI